MSRECGPITSSGPMLVRPFIYNKLHETNGFTRETKRQRGNFFRSELQRIINVPKGQLGRGEGREGSDVVNHTHESVLCWSRHGNEARNAQQ